MGKESASSRFAAQVGDSESIVLGLCATCYTPEAAGRRVASAACGKRSFRAMAIVAVAAGHEKGRSSSVAT
jgi:hypothetical protein